MITRKDKEFIGLAITECLKYGVKVEFSPHKSVKDDYGRYAGCFTERNDKGEKEIRIAAYYPFKAWIQIFIHEYCHFLQWKDGDPAFAKLSRSRNLDNDIWDWLAGKDIPMRRVKNSIRAYQKMELECEKKVVKLIDEYGLSIDKNMYIRGANSYVLFYGIIEKTRKWFKNSPTDLKLMIFVPKTFIKNFKFPEHYEEVARKVCY